MAVVAMWKCDRDDAMFDSKKGADAHDKMLELAEGFGSLLEKHIPNISEQDAENIGLLLSRNKDILVAACKGKPEMLLDLQDLCEDESSNVTPLAGRA